MIRACRRCGRNPASLLVKSARGLDKCRIEEKIALCGDCRTQAGYENAAAQSRRTVSTNITAYRRMGYLGELPPELRS